MNEKQYVLSINKASVGYQDNIILKDFSLNLFKGDKLIITGQNGSGKTTLLKSIMRLIPLLEGSILVRKNISYCKQDYHDINFPVSAKEVIQMGFYKEKISKKDKDEKFTSLVKLTNTENLQDRLFNTLSGGERQRVNIARCLCQNFDLLLLDEPTSYIDEFSKDNLISILKDNSFKEKTIIAVTHDKKIESELAWKILNLDKLRDENG